jgi:2-polyprenyl-3-methyl-5-hydroxy-6-metoxy-1,4-benzoquinol methylase
MKNHSLQEFLEFVEQKNILHAKFLKTSLSDITDKEIIKFESLLRFYMQMGNDTLEQIVDKYLHKISFIMEEQLYFFQHNKYRFSTYSEVENYYKDPAYMDSYTIGLGLSTYLWRVHREVMRFFVKYLTMSNITNGWYFEIGPGHGEYFATAMQETNFEQYTAIDISKTSVELTQRYINYSIENIAKKYTVIHDDFFNYHNDKLFDAVVMGEVLEHVENPAAFLKKIHQIAADNAHIFITTAINAPMPDHIYLFNNLNEVIELFKKENFDVIDYIAVNTNNVPIDKAEKRKIPIVCGFILKKI